LIRLAQRNSCPSWPHNYRSTDTFAIKEINHILVQHADAAVAGGCDAAPAPSDISDPSDHDEAIYFVMTSCFYVG